MTISLVGLVLSCLPAQQMVRPDMCSQPDATVVQQRDRMQVIQNQPTLPPLAQKLFNLYTKPLSFYLTEADAMYAEYNRKSITLYPEFTGNGLILGMRIRF